MIERFESVPADVTQGTYALRKVEMNAYDDIPSPTTLPTSVTHQAAISETGGVITYSQDKVELDGHGRTIKKTVVGGTNGNQVTTFHFNADGTLHDLTLPDPTQNNLSTVQYDYTFDSLGRAKSIRRPDSTVQLNRSGVDITYDGVTTQTSEFVGGALGQVAVTKTTNDSFGRLVRVDEERVAAPLTWATTLYAYDANNNINQITDPESKVTKLGHDFASRRIQIQRLNGATTKTWTYDYDKAGNMTRETTPCLPVGTCEATLAYSTTTAYDAFNHPTSRLIAPRTLSIADKDLFGAVQETFDWDLGANGRNNLVHWFTNGTTSSNPMYQWFVHDAQGRRMMNWQGFNGGGFSNVRASMHTFHPGGNPATDSYGDYAMGGTVQTVSKVAYDARGLPSTISISTDHGNTFPTIVTQTRNVAGLVTKRSGNLGTGANTVESNWGYDKLGRVLDQNVQKLTPGTVPVAHQHLTYFGNDDPVTLVHTLGALAAKTFTYAYDLRHQLTGVSTSTSSFFGATYGYGNAGRFASANENRTGSVVPTSDLVARNVNYVYGGADAEQVTALTNVSGGARFATFTYDDAGNMLTRCMGATFTPTCTGELLTYLYDGKDQLRRATRRLNNVIAGSEEYWYDSDGNRTQVRKLNASGASTELIWYVDQTEHHLTATNLPAGTETRAYSHVSLGTPVARIDRTFDNVAPIEYQFHGLASSTLATVDKVTGTINASFSYAPFGEVLEATDAGAPSSGLAFHKRKFNDKVQDDLTALTYYGARYYDKTLIGWTQADPMYRFAPDSAWASPRRSACYMFSGQNPLRYIDPDGRDFGREVMRLAHEAAPTEVADPGPAGGAESAIDRGMNMLNAASNPISAAVAQNQTGLMDTINNAVVAQMVPESLDRRSEVQKLGSSPPPPGRPSGPNNSSETRLGTAGGERAGMGFTPAGKEVVKQSNIDENGIGAGGGVCERCGGDMVPSTQSRSGVSPAPNEVRVDHIDPRVPEPGSGMPPGDGSPPNGQAICYTCNGDKSNKAE